jgi:hypothetical protein
MFVFTHNDNTYPNREFRSLGKDEIWGSSHWFWGFWSPGILCGGSVTPLSWRICRSYEPPLSKRERQLPATQRTDPEDENCLRKTLQYELTCVGATAFSLLDWQRRCGGTYAFIFAAGDGTGSYSQIAGTLFNKAESVASQKAEESMTHCVRDWCLTFLLTNCLFCNLPWNDIPYKCSSTAADIRPLNHPVIMFYLLLNQCVVSPTFEAFIQVSALVHYTLNYLF